MPFGRHRGAELRDIPTSYLQWVLCAAEAADHQLKWAVWAELSRRASAYPQPPPHEHGLIDVEGLKARLAHWFRGEAFRHHPDRGGGAKVMTALNNAYARLQQLLGV
jgi:hypothetical protein